MFKGQTFIIIIISQIRAWCYRFITSFIQMSTIFLKTIWANIMHPRVWTIFFCLKWFRKRRTTEKASTRCLNLDYTWMLCAIITTAKEAFCLMTKNAISMMNSILSPQLNDFVLYLMYFIIKQIMSLAYSKSMRLFLASSTASLSIFHVPANCLIPLYHCSV